MSVWSVKENDVMRYSCIRPRVKYRFCLIATSYYAMQSLVCHHIPHGMYHCVGHQHVIGVWSFFYNPPFPVRQFANKNVLRVKRLTALNQL